MVNAEHGTTWWEKYNVLPTFYSSKYNMSVTIESLIQKRTTVAGSNIKKNYSGGSNIEQVQYSDGP